MRVVSGKYRSRVLSTFKGNDIRPTSDFAKESLFNILGNVNQKTFLDLFAGTGSMGIECISRGGISVFTDNNKESVNLIKKNLQSLNETAQVSLVDGVKYLLSTSNKFDIIFIDPPYKSDLGEKALNAISQNKVLNENGIAIFESDKEGTEIENLERYSVRKYGKAYLTFYRYEK